MPLTFEVLDAESGVFTYPDEIYDAVMADFDGLLDEYESGQIGDKRYLVALERLLAEAPDFVDAYAHIATHWHQQGKPKKALDTALVGLSISNRLIPEGFTGRVEWGHLDNRPYLRAMHVALLSYMRLRRHKDAVTLIELMLARNPNDNQGVRFLLGSELLRAGDHDRARAVLEEEADGYPPYFYELALCHILRDDWVAAATALRRGFAANPYIAEILAGNPNPAPLAIWHGTNLAEPETAREYMQMYGMLWHRQPDSFAFTRWLFNHPKILAERAAIMECMEAVLWEPDAATRSELALRGRQLTASIDGTLSAAIVTKRKDRRGNVIWPWALA
ncbi:tetratricopeptide repeat protein [Massilia cavernae]|uniref:Tetratricopeptide repeat protein n=1 Tax=Massilia cavernae TaxID=2320864 RepID=A0A418Y811_9BURK|nr:tetratricopeptide repeat protein [Massilia cavernae]RJG27313.1 tetratricopeptide repeat protein [Massilia cavernae]